MRRRWLTMRGFQGALHGFTGRAACMRALLTGHSGGWRHNSRREHFAQVPTRLISAAPSKCQRGPCAFRCFGLVYANAAMPDLDVICAGFTWQHVRPGDSERAGSCNPAQCGGDRSTQEAGAGKHGLKRTGIISLKQYALLTARNQAASTPYCHSLSFKASRPGPAGSAG